jgi:hypothetical protein
MIKKKGAVVALKINQSNLEINIDNQTVDG